MQDTVILELNGQKVAAMAQNSDGSDMNFMPFANDDYQLLPGHTDGLTEPNFLQQLLAPGSENSSIIQNQDPEISVSALQYLNNNHSLPPQTSRSADQSNYYQSGSPQNEPQYHTFGNMGGLYHHASPSHAGMSPPSSMTPTSPKKSPTVSDRRFTFAAQPHPMAYPMAHQSAQAPLQALPETSPFPGEYGFELSFGPPTPGATKSIDYTYSHVLKKLYVQRAAHCPFKFKSERHPPDGSYIKVLPVYKGTHVLSEPVKRCSNHAVSEEETGNLEMSQQRYHFVRSDNASAKYEALESGRLYVTFPFLGPQVGAEFQTELLSFQCFNSCGNSAHAKRRIDVIFTLEHQNVVLGRQVIEVRVCACPGRDRQNEEQNQSGGQRKRRTSYSIAQNAKRKRAGSSVEQYVVTTANQRLFEILLNIKTLLEPILEPRTLEGQSFSPSSDASSPRQAKNQTVPESESDED